MSFGVDYYPEHWNKERWKYDAGLMKAAGISVVRLAEFAWIKLEPEPGAFDFKWLDDAIDILAQEGIRIVLGTPTAVPPVWLIEEYPDILPVNLEGKRLGFGGRHHDCQSNETYHSHIRRFLRIMAAHYSTNPNVIGWQIDNEFGNSHNDLCACASCHRAFHRWLENKYISIECLNEAWGTVFWSQTYQRFDQIPLPLPTPNAHNPSLLLDWKRFASDLIVSFQKIQIDILKAECPNHFITHNFMGFFDKTNYYDLAKELDFVSHDQYPLLFRNGMDLTASPMRSAAALSLMRGMKRKAFWIMEQQAGAAGWQEIGAAPRPGQLKLWTYQSVAHGADTVVYFRWRSCLFGAEQYWHGILPHSGEPGRQYEEIKKTITELTPVVKAFEECLPEAEAAIIFSYDEDWAFKIQPHHPDLDYIRHIQGYYEAFYNANVPVDFISPDTEFSGYKLLVAPLMFLVTPELLKKLEEFVAKGGHLILTMRTAVKNWNNKVISKTLPGDISPVVGIRIEEYDCLREIKQAIRWVNSEGDSKEGEVSKWCDIITLDGAEALSVYQNDFYKGTPAITRHRYKKGIGYYIGTELGTSSLKQLVARITDNAAIKAVINSPDGVEVTRRRGRNADYFFVMNHNNTDAELPIPIEWQVVIGTEYIKEGRLYLGAYQTAVFSADL